MASCGCRFANETLPALVFENPLSFARAVAHPRRGGSVLVQAWERAGGGQAPLGLKATVMKVDPYTVIHVEPPFAREVGDACAIVIVGRGDGQSELEDVRYFAMEIAADERSAALRFVVVARDADGTRSEVGEAVVDVSAFVTQCVELATGSTPTPRDARTIPAWYWWHVCRGDEAMGVFCEAGEALAWQVIYQYPVLLLPELAVAAEHALGWSYAIEGLRQMHQSLRGTPQYAPFHRMLATALAHAESGSPRVNVGRALEVIVNVRNSVTEFGADLGRTSACEAMIRARLAALGVDPQRNYEKAIELCETAHTLPATDADRAHDLELEQRTRAALDELPAAPVARGSGDLMWIALFLDHNELPGYQRRDERETTPGAIERAFVAHGGVTAGHTIWMGTDTAPVHRIVDARWMFPSAKAANAFLQAAATTTGDGLPSLPLAGIGDGGYAWGGHKSGRARAQIMLFRVGRIVVKLAVTEGPKAHTVFQTLSQAMLVPFAETIVKRARWTLAQYWLGVGSGIEAANKFVQATPKAAGQLFAQYPILLLPEFPTAMASLGEEYRVAAEQLARAQASLKNNWSAYRDAMRALVRVLLEERAGEPRVNADAALGLVVDHRRLDSDYSWAAVEAECRELITSSGRRP